MIRIFAVREKNELHEIFALLKEHHSWKFNSCIALSRMDFGLKKMTGLGFIMLFINRENTLKVFKTLFIWQVTDASSWINGSLYRIPLQAKVLPLPYWQVTARRRYASAKSISSIMIGVTQQSDEIPSNQIKARCHQKPVVLTLRTRTIKKKCRFYFFAQKVMFLCLSKEQKDPDP